MNLFNVLPDKLFGVLASPLKVEYSEVLFAIYASYRRAGLGLERSVVLDIIDECLDNLVSSALDEDLLSDAGVDVSNPRWRVYTMLSKLERSGWLRTETLTDHRQIVTIPDYAFRLLEVLDRLRSGYQEEYQGYVYATYSALWSEEVKHNGSIALETAHSQTLALVTGLRNLRDNIKAHIEKVLASKEPKDILKLHFEEYRKDIIDKSYHRLKTSDNVSRYRPRIIQRVNELYEDEQWVRLTAAAELRRDRFNNMAEAIRNIYSRLGDIRRVYSELDDLLEEIDRRNLQYARSSYNMLQMMLQSGTDVSGQITEILKLLADILRDGDARGADDMPQELSHLFSIYSQAYLERASLYTARDSARQHKPQDITMLSTLTEDERQSRLRSYKAKIAARITRGKIDAFVKEWLGERDQADAAELPLNTIDDFIRLIYIAAYSRSPRVGYSIERGVGDRRLSGELTVSDNGQYVFRNYKIVRKWRRSK